MASSRDVKALEQAVGKRVASYLLNQPSDTAPQTRALSSRLGEFEIEGVQNGIAANEQLALHLGGENPNDVVLACPVEIEDNPEIRRLVEAQSTGSSRSTE